MTSFACAAGLPREADLASDVGLLRNSGRRAVRRDLARYGTKSFGDIQAGPQFGAALPRICDLLAPALPRYGQEGKSYLIMAVGRTGGGHRLVRTAELLNEVLARTGGRVATTHRKLGQAEPRWDASGGSPWAADNSVLAGRLHQP